VTDELTPQMIAEYDQALKLSDEFFGALVASYMENRAKDALNGFPEAVSVLACSFFLKEQLTHAECASALAAAILRAIAGDQW
jgi:hypothetical protein